MSRAFAFLTMASLALVTAVTVAAPPPTFQDALLDRMVGTWVLRGTIAG